jgi:hypothetical protein
MVKLSQIPVADQIRAANIFHRAVAKKHISRAEKQYILDLVKKYETSPADPVIIARAATRGYDVTGIKVA